MINTSPKSNNFILFTTLLFISCQNKIINNKDKFPINLKKPIVIDRLTENRINRNAVWLTRMVYPIMYAGPYTDTIKLWETHKNDYSYEQYSKKNYKLADSLEMKIFVDTTTVISGYAGYHKSCDGTKYIKAYPTFIINLSSDTIQVEYNSSLSLILEAINQNGNWQRIEKSPTYTCGTGLKSGFLPPKEMILTRTIIYEGKFKTKLRLRSYKNITSNEFTGTINLTQFIDKKL